MKCPPASLSSLGKCSHSKSSTAPIRIFSAPPVHLFFHLLHLQYLSSHRFLLLCHNDIFPPFLSPSLCCVKARIIPVVGGGGGEEPLRNGKQTRRVCKHRCTYRWCSAERQESLRCSTLSAAAPLGLSLHVRHTPTDGRAHAHEIQIKIPYGAQVFGNA